LQWIEKQETVRFNEVDEWGMAWHGHYIAWFEAGRMALLRRFDLLPKQLVALGYIAPIIRIQCEFKHPAECGDEIIIRTSAIKPEIAVLTFQFEIVRKSDQVLLARGESTQVLMTTEKKMIYRVQGELEKRITDLATFCEEKGYNTKA
jgi:acyl-CoA thioester hydrolase